MLALKRDEFFAEHQSAENVRGSDTDAPGDIHRNLTDIRLSGQELSFNRFCSLQQAFASGREFDSFGMAVEETNPRFVFQNGDTATYSCMIGVQSPRCGQ